MSHSAYTLLLALLISAVLAIEGRRPTRERIYAGIYCFCCAIGAVIAGGWLMHCVHG